MALESLLNLFSQDLAIDLGTATTLVFARGKGIVLNEPSVVAVQRDHKHMRKVLAVGRDAKVMLGRTPGNIIAIRPMRDGVISDFDTTEAMLRYFIKKVHPTKKWIRPRIVICVPDGITPVEKRAVREAAVSAGARAVYLVEEPLAAAIGAGLPITEPAGNMIVDIGGGTSEVAVISLAGIVQSRSLRVAGDKMDEAIIRHIKRKYNLLIGQQTAERIKIAKGTATAVEDDSKMEVKGRDLINGTPKTIRIDSRDIHKSLDEPLAAIIQSIRMTLERTPPELSADIMDRGIMLAGGGAQLRNLDILISSETGLPVTIADDPSTCVAVGAGKILEEIDLLKEIAN